MNYTKVRDIPPGYHGKTSTMKPSPIQIGDRVRINRGIFTGCIGTAISVHDSRVRIKLFTTGAICWCRKKNVTKLSSEPSIPTTHVILNTDPNSKVHPGIELPPDCELRIRVIHNPTSKPTLDISTVKVTHTVPPPPPVPPLPPFLPIDLRGELVAWLKTKKVNRNTIGLHLTACSLPWDSQWNVEVAQAVAEAAVDGNAELDESSPEPPAPAPGASPSPLDPPTSPSQQMPASSHWKPKNILPATPGLYQTIRWFQKTSAWTNTPFFEFAVRMQYFSGQWLIQDGDKWLTDDNFSHWLDSDQLASGPLSGSVIP